MMTDIEKARLLIEQNARLIDKQNLDEGMESLSQGQQHRLNSRTSAGDTAANKLLFQARRSSRKS